MDYLDHKKDGKDSYMVIKFDINKTYDRVEWGFIENVMVHIGFHEKWTSLIMHYITIVTYSILINGVANGCIIPTKGLRQGDPLSSYLFLFCADGISSLINEVARNKLINGISICRGCPTITYLFFADDNLLLCKASRQECQKLTEFLTSMRLHWDRRLTLMNCLFSLAIIHPAKRRVRCLRSSLARKRRCCQ